MQKRRSVLDQFASLEAVEAAFPDEQAAIDFVFLVRWGVWPTCPFCASRRKFCHFRDGRSFKCLDCRRRFSVSVGTHLSHTKIRLRAWLIASWYATHTERPSSSHLARVLGVTQKTAWSTLDTLKRKGPTLEAMLATTWRRKGSDMADDDKDDDELLPLEERLRLHRARQRWSLVQGKAAAPDVRDQLKEERAALLAEIAHQRTMREKDPDAVSLGRRGGLKGGPARKRSLSPERRSEIAKNASEARWRKNITPEQQAAIDAFLVAHGPTVYTPRSAQNRKMAERRWGDRSHKLDKAIAFLRERNGSATINEAAQHAGVTCEQVQGRLHTMRDRGDVVPAYARAPNPLRISDDDPRLVDAVGWCLEAGFSTAEASERTGVSPLRLKERLEQLESEGADVSMWRDAMRRAKGNSSSKGALTQQKKFRGED